MPGRSSGAGGGGSPTRSEPATPGQPTAVADGGALPPRGASAVISRMISARSASDGSPHSGR